MSTWSERGLRFGTVARDYQRFRLDYPVEVARTVLDYAGRPVRTAIEIGAGTGKATRLFASAGVAVTAVEPDPAMLAELTARMPGSVTPVLGTFESADLHGPVDLVYAAAALHWTDPATRWARIGSLLPPGGVVASFGGPRRIADARLREQVRRVRQAYVADEEVYSPSAGRRDAALHWPGDEMDDSPLFTDVVQDVVERRLAVTAEEFIGELSTVSAYLALDPDRRAEVFARIRSVLPDRIEVAADLTVHLARRT